MDMTHQTAALLRSYADQFETPHFLDGDPSWFMHQVAGERNQEVMAFIASCLSYGSRKQFLPKIELLRRYSHNEPYHWVASGSFGADIPDDETCFYRLYTHRTMHQFLCALRDMLLHYGSIGQFASHAVEHGDRSMGASLRVLLALGQYFRSYGLTGIVPQPVSSLCKRPIMFLRWMVRDHSPVDLGLWSERIDKSSLYIPVDTHVVQTARRLHLISSKSISWNTTLSLTQAMSQIFPDDPARGDYALYGADIMLPADGKAK